MSAQHVLTAADKSRFALVPLGVTREGVWLSEEETRAALAVPEPPFKKTLRSSRRDITPPVEVLASADVVFPLIHGRHGEDGSLQGLLELLEKPYVGCGVAASAVGMDKGLMKAVFSAAGLRVAKHIVLSVPAEAQERELLQATREAEERLGLPVFVKPANGGSSLGVSKARSREEMSLALLEAARFDRRVLVEEAIEGREVECGVLGNQALQASPVGEVRHQREFYDYEAKYLDPRTEVIAPADLPPETVERVQAASLTAFRAMAGSGLARVDYFLGADGSLIIDEINTLPGFTPASMFPRLWAAAGVSYSELITRVVELAIERYKERPVA